MIKKRPPLEDLNGGFPKLGVPFWGVICFFKDYSILGSVLGSPYCGKLPNIRIPIIIPIKGRGLINHGSGLAESLTLLLFSFSSMPSYGLIIPCPGFTKMDRNRGV